MCKIIAQCHDNKVKSIQNKFLLETYHRKKLI